MKSTPSHRPWLSEIGMEKTVMFFSKFIQLLNGEKKSDNKKILVSRVMSFLCRRHLFTGTLHWQRLCCRSRYNINTQPWWWGSCSISRPVNCFSSWRSSLTAFIACHARTFHYTCVLDVWHFQQQTIPSCSWCVKFQFPDSKHLIVSATMWMRLQ